MELNNQQIKDLTPDIWQAVLQLPLQPHESVPQPAGKVLSACVYIAGAWNGAVALSCDIELAAKAAIIMFDLAGTLPSPGEVRDALGELTNMVGGNIKALLPEPCYLSLPLAAEGSDYSVRILNSKVVARLPFRCGEHSMSLSVLQKEEKAA